MPIDYEALRVRIGLVSTDNSKDADIALSYKTALSLIERYCDRKFESQQEIESFTHVQGNSLSLERYPVTKINALTINDTNNIVIPKYHIDDDNGLILFDGRTVAHRLTVDYIGGYDPLPDDLLFALYDTFDQAYSHAQNPGGSTGSGAVKTARLGAASITWDVGSGGGGGQYGGMIPAGASAILDAYKREYV